MKNFLFAIADFIYRWFFLLPIAIMTLILWLVFSPVIWLMTSVFVADCPDDESEHDE